MPQLPGEFIFRDGTPHSGISQKNGLPYTLYKLKALENKTFKVVQFQYKDQLNLTHVAPGDVVTLDYDIAEARGYSDSYIVITAVNPVKVPIR